jgi:hypothetical protein
MPPRQAVVRRDTTGYSCQACRRMCSVAAADGNQVHQEGAFTLGRSALAWGMITSSAPWPASG